ncbi:MAG: S-methyl-5'-thioadenosine phosphorylase [Proteobacteria bacterium]|nr:S-methyl-5'-thioadenosine phosphorylase [Pseudomonadota bacterium]
MSPATLGVIGGSGLYRMEGLADVDEIEVSTAFGNPSDRIVQARLGQVRFLFLPRHGREHHLPPHRINYRANILALKQLGAQQIVSVSAVGSLDEQLRPGELVLVDQFLDRTTKRANTFFEDHGVVVHVGLADPIDPALADAITESAERVGVHVHRGGTYVCIEGPQFSTRAESHLYRAWGAAVVGMTNLPEARLAREAQLPYASMAWVTDYDCWHQTEAPVSVEAVLAVLQANARNSQRILSELTSRLPDPAKSPASKALEDAVLTDLAGLPPATLADLGPLLARPKGNA